MPLPQPGAIRDRNALRALARDLLVFATIAAAFYAPWALALAG